MPRVLTWKKMAQLAAARNILNQSPSRAAPLGVLRRPAGLGSNQSPIQSSSSPTKSLCLSSGITRRQLETMHARLVVHRRMLKMQGEPHSAVNRNRKTSTSFRGGHCKIDAQDGISFGEFEVLVAQCALAAPSFRGKPEQRLDHLARIMGLKV